jgi:hypothetical protein
MGTLSLGNGGAGRQSRGDVTCRPGVVRAQMSVTSSAMITNDQIGEKGHEQDVDDDAEAGQHHGS